MHHVSRNMKSLGLVSIMLLCFMPFQNCGQGFKPTRHESPAKADDRQFQLTPEQLAIDPYFDEASGPQTWESPKPTLDVGVTPGVSPLSQLAYNAQGIFAAALSGPQIAFYKSIDRGNTWELPHGQLRSAGTNRAFRFLKLFGGAGQNRIYMATFSSRATNPTTDRQFDLEFSEDGGKLWSRVQTGHGEVWDLLDAENQLHVLATPVQLLSGPQNQVIAPCVYLSGNSRNPSLLAKDTVGESAPEYVSSEARCGKIFVKGTRVAYSYVMRHLKQNNDEVITSHLRVSNNSGEDWETTNLNQTLGAGGEWKLFRDRFGTMFALLAGDRTTAGQMKISFDLGVSWKSVPAGTEIDMINRSSVVTSDFLGNIYLATSFDIGANQAVTRKTCLIPAAAIASSNFVCTQLFAESAESDHGFIQDLIVVGRRMFWIGLSGQNTSRSEFTIRRFY